jgi:uncharacterized Ntn-hydrolase superfamily protein
VSPVRTGTYSIVARDEASGSIGAAVQSHWFSVGSVVTWGAAGVGAVATQSVAEPAYGPRLLDRLESGEEPREALAALTAADPAARFRQVAVVGADGEVAVHTGEGCIAHAGHLAGDGFSVQANMMATEAVWPAMAEAFSAADGPLSRRMLASLEAGEVAGGDVRGRQSAALLIVPAKGESWRREVELRVEDDPEPLAELSRLLDLHDAYALAGEGDELSGQGQDDEASRLYREAAQLAPDNEELLFWSGLAQLKSGEPEAGTEVLKRVMATNDGWRQLLLRLDEDLAPGIGEARRALDL